MRIEQAVSVQAKLAESDSLYFTLGVDNIVGIEVIDHGVRFVVTRMINTSTGAAEVQTSYNGPFLELWWQS